MCSLTATPTIMRKLAPLFFALVFILTCSFSCRKVNSSNYISATVNGESWIADESMATQTTEGITIQGTVQKTGSNVALYLPRDYTVGTYNFDTSGTFGNTAHASYIAHNYDNSFRLSHVGTITVKSVSTYITGTFSFTCTDSTHVQDGVFSVRRP